jgi:hypothetical protein
MDASLGVDPAEASFPSLGTRFRIFPQAPFVPGYERPETVWLSGGSRGRAAWAERSQDVRHRSAPR